MDALDYERDRIESRGMDAADDGYEYNSPPQEPEFNSKRKLYLVFLGLS